MLVGRVEELALLERLLEDARNSTGQAVVLRGAAGIGKSALLEATQRRAEGMTVLRAQGVEAEVELAFAGLHQLLRGVLEHLPRLPEPQQRELGAALGLASGGAVNRFLISAAVLSLLAEAAEERPLLCLVDDVHWLDRASAEALLFAARRLRAEPVAMVFAARDTGEPAFPAAGLVEHRVRGLDPAAAASVLAGPSAGAVPLDIATRLVEATEGNPFALTELRSALSTAQLRGGEPLPVPLPLTDDLAGRVLARYRALPPRAATLLLVAAADDTGSTGSVLPAAARLGVPADALAPAERAGLIGVEEDRLTFRHPLVRAAILRSAASADRRAAHEALAAVLVDDPDRRAWHRASAAVGSDDDAAADLLAAADRARDRGAFDAASAAMERAAQLAAAGARGGHLVQAAHDAWLGGQTDRARRLTGVARPLVDHRHRPQLDRLTGMVEFRCGRPADAFGILIRAAEQCTDDSRAIHLLAEASEAASIAGDIAGCAHAATLAERLPQPAAVEDAALRDLVVGMGRLLTGDRERALEPLHRVVAASGHLAEVIPLAQAGRAAWYLGDEQRARSSFERAVQLARTGGQLGLLPYALNRLAACEFVAGRWASATGYYEEGLELARSTGQEEMVGHLLGGLAQVAAFRGDEQQLSSFEEEFRRVAEPRGLVLPEDQVAWARGHLRVTEGRAVEALAAVQGIRHPAVLTASLVDRVDAAVHAGEEELARAWLDAVVPAAGAPLPRLPAGHAHARALVVGGDEAESCLRHAAGPTAEGRPFDRFRAALALGEHLRREGRRRDARSALEAALHGFLGLGADRWADRARRELRAAGRSTRAAAPGPNARLTPQELQVARYTSEGRPTREVAALLFLSPRTVDYHLRNVFAKLGIASRTELASLHLDRLTG